MALFDRFRLDIDEIERRLARPLSGDPSRGEKGILTALDAGRIEEVRLALDGDEALGPDFKEALRDHLGSATRRWDTLKSWSVSVPLPVWDEYAREARQSGASISRCLAGAVQRDYDRRRASSDPLDALRTDVLLFHRAAAHVLDEVQRLAHRAGDLQNMALRLQRIEQLLEMAAPVARK